MTGNALRRTLFPMILMLAACGGGGGERKPLPSIQIAAPIDGATVTGSRSITVTGTGANMDSVEVRLNGTAVADASVTATATEFTASVTLGDNANTIEAVATNASGTASSGVVTVTYPFARFTTFQPAAVVIGQPDFIHGGENEGGTSAATVRGSWGNPLVSAGKLYVADNWDNRVLVFDPVPTTNGASASLVLGQPDFTTVVAGRTASTWEGPETVATDGAGRLLVVDFENNRVLVLNREPTVSSPAADLVVGQADMTSPSVTDCTRGGLDRPESVFAVGGKLLVADSGHHRVLVWNGIPTNNGAPADLVLGQADFSHCAANAGGTTGPGGLAYPTDVWSDGTRIVVADSWNNRVLVWNTFPTVNGAPADLAVGQADLVSAITGSGSGALNGPWYLSSNGNQLVVADYYNSRVLIWNGFPTSSGALADVVLGQGDFGRSQFNDDDQDGKEDDAPTARTLGGAAGVSLSGTQLFVADPFNKRLLIYDAR